MDGLFVLECAAARAFSVRCRPHSDPLASAGEGSDEQIFLGRPTRLLVVTVSGLPPLS